jgi:single-stranded-DNA-specific exonuclease
MHKVTAQDLGFYVGPRLNAAGRLDDMALGIRCLLADHIQAAMPDAQQLQALNVERRQIEAGMQQEALADLEEVTVADRFTLSIYQPEWHQGVIGILASRIKEQYHRPVIAFASAGEGLLKGSGRSIPGLHLRDALDYVTKQHPTLIIKFGGHAMAAGLTIRDTDFFTFQQAFETAVRTYITVDDLQEAIETDGALTPDEMTLETASLLEKQVWGQGFPPPMFYDQFRVVSQRILGEKHLKLQLQKGQSRYDAIYFNQAELLPEQVHAVYQLQINDYKGQQQVQLQLKYAHA